MTLAAAGPCDRGLIETTAHAGAGEFTAGRKRLILAATIVGSSMGFIDSSVVNVALPAIQRDLHAGSGAVQWIVSGYLLTLGALVLIGGAAADRYGRRRVFLLGIALFTAASVGCGLAPGPGVLVAARLAQGVGAAMLTPSSLAILGASFPPEERGRAVGAWAGFGALTAAAGPVLGGALVDAVSWRAIFFINLPLAAIAAALTWKAVPESRAPSAGPLDSAGAALAASGLGLAIWALTRAQAGPAVRPAVIVPAVAGLAALTAFAVVEARAAQPMAPPRMFRSKDFSGANLLTFFLYFALGGTLFFLPFELIRVRGYVATAAGAALLPFSLVMGTMSGAAGRLADRVGPKAPLVLGPLIAAAGFFALGRASGVQSYWVGIFPATLLLAVGMTLSVAPLTSTVMGAVGPDRAGTAAGVNNAVARIAGLFAVVVMTLIFSGAVDRGLRARLGARDRPAAGTALTLRPATAPAAVRTSELAALQAAFGDVMTLAAVCAVAAGAFGALLIDGKASGAPRAEARASHS